MAREELEWLGRVGLCHKHPFLKEEKRKQVEKEVRENVELRLQKARKKT